MNRKPLNILFLASWYPNVVEPQDGNFIQRHAAATAKVARVATLYVMSLSEAKTFKIEKRWHQNVFEVIVYYPKTIKILPFIKLQRYKKAHHLGYETIVNELGSLDLVHLNVCYPAGIFAHVLKEQYQLPYVITEHWTAFLDSNPHQFNPYQRFVIQRCGREAAAIFPVSQDLKKAMESEGLQNDFHVIPNVVDTAIFTNQAMRSERPKIKILHVSTLYDPHKNISGILNMVAKLSKQRQDFTIKIVGNDYVEKHQTYAKSLGIPMDIIDIQGETPYEEIAQLMQEHDIFLLFSNYENLPCVISEAHVAGLPVLSSDVGGIAEMINEQNGILIPSQNEEKLQSQLNYLMDHLDQYDRTNIRSAAIARYSYETVGKQYLDLYHRVLNNG